jgi:FolB domain-containing protein
VPNQDRIIIEDLLLRGIIGLNEWEREKKQDILINLTLFTDLRAAGASDHLDDILNYRTITKLIIDYVENSQHYLIEALATAIARLCVDHGAERVIVRVEKPGALRFARSVGVEIERERSDFEQAG